MKKVSVGFLFVMTLLIFILIYAASYAQEKKKILPNTAAIKDTVIAGTKYPIYMGSKGGRYIIRTSKVTGNEYKQYLKKQ